MIDSTRWHPTLATEHGITPRRPARAWVQSRNRCTDAECIHAALYGPHRSSVWYAIPSCPGKSASCTSAEDAMAGFR